MRSSYEKGKKGQARPKKEDGFILIVSIIILAAVGTALVAALLSSSVGGYKVARLAESSFQARGAADACAEIALQKLAALSSFTGTGSATITPGSCTYSVVSSGSVDTVTATGIVGTIVRKVKVLILVPQLLISSWDEVGDF